MANKYVYSSAAGGATGADWANAYTTLAAAADDAAGDDIYVAHDHAESNASAQTIAFAGTAASPNRVMCVDRGGSVPPVAADLRTTGTVTTTGANAITIQGHAYIYGLTISCGTGGTSVNFALANTASSKMVYERCNLRCGTSNASQRIIASTTSSLCEFIDCAVQFASANQALQSGVNLRWQNSLGFGAAVTAGTLPTVLFLSTAARGLVELIGLDLSALGSGKTIFGTPQALCYAINCKLDASVTPATAPTVRNDAGADFLASGATGIVARNERYRYSGTLTTETTIIRTGGASDGVTPVSWKVVTTANCKKNVPFDTFEGEIWNTTVGSVTLAIHIVTDNVTLTDEEIYVEAEYIDQSGNPGSTRINDAPATQLTAAANQASSSETWTTTGLGTPVKQKLEVTFSPDIVGLIRWRVRVQKASATVYVCPKAELS